MKLMRRMRRAPEAIMFCQTVLYPLYVYAEREGEQISYYILLYHTIIKTETLDPERAWDPSTTRDLPSMGTPQRAQSAVVNEYAGFRAEGYMPNKCTPCLLKGYWALWDNPQEVDESRNGQISFSEFLAFCKKTKLFDTADKASEASQTYRSEQCKDLQIPALNLQTSDAKPPNPYTKTIQHPSTPKLRYENPKHPSTPKP